MKTPWRKPAQHGDSDDDDLEGAQPTEMRRIAKTPITPVGEAILSLYQQEITKESTPIKRAQHAKSHAGGAQFVHPEVPLQMAEQPWARIAPKPAGREA